MKSISDMSLKDKKRQLYVDVTGFFYHEGRNLTGIYRVEYELGRHLSSLSNEFQTSIIYWNGEDYEKLNQEDFINRDFKKYRLKLEQASSKSYGIMTTVFSSWKTKLYRYLVEEDKAAVDELLAAYGKSFEITCLALSRIVSGVMSRLSISRAFQKTAPIPAPSKSWARTVGKKLSSGSILLVPTSAWVSNERYARFLNSVIHERELRFVPIVCDLIPLDYPYYVTTANASAFKFGFSVAWRKAEKIITISEYSREQIRKRLPDWKKDYIDIDIIRLGGNISHQHADEDRSIPSSEWQTKIDGENFVIFVSTLNPRKNHLFLLKLWEELYDIHGDRLPILVFVGQAGWHYQGIFSAMDAMTPLQHKLVFTDGVSERELHWLYRNTMFSVYPSIIEGWGLPITESLSFGKVCVSSNTSAMKEAAGKFSPVCDPADMDRWIEAVSRLIDDKKNLEYYEKIIGRDFVEVTWENTANDVLNSLLD